MNYKIFKFINVSFFVVALSIVTTNISSAQSPDTTTGGTDASVITGCDPNIEQQLGLIANSLTQNSINGVNEAIQQPPDASMMTCGDQRLAAYDQASKTFSQPGGGSSQFMADLQNSFKSSVGANVTNVVPNTASEAAARAYSRSVSNNSGQAALNSTCTTMDEVWAAIGCNPFAGVIGLDDILENQLNRVTDALGNIINAPNRLIESVCRAAQSEFSDAMRGIEGMAEDSVKAFTSPITDSLDNIDNRIDDSINNITDL